MHYIFSRRKTEKKLEVFCPFVYFTGNQIQCFDAVGWAAGRASGL